MLLKPYRWTAPLLLLLMAAVRCCLAAAGSSGSSDDGGRFALNGFAGANLTLGGASTVLPNGLLMLTNGATRSMKGHAFHPSPLLFGSGSNGTGPVRSFSTTFVLAIFGHDEYADLSSRGLAFFISTSWEVLSTALRGLNNGNQSASIFAIEFDTLYDAEFRNINRYVGVDGDSLVSLNSANTGYYDDGTGRLLNLSVISWKAIQVWVDYDSRAMVITMTMAPLGMVRPKRPMLQTTIDLSCVVQSMAYVGFSSATRNITSGHFILGWSFALDGPAPVLDISVLPALPSAWTKNNRSIPPPSMSMALKLMLALASMTLVSVGIGIYVSARRRLNCSDVQEDWEVSLGPNRFSYKDLFHATEGFSEKNLLGRGGFGSVYKGVIHKPDMEVAVKRMSHDSRQGVKEFIAEVVSIGRLRHRNLAKLLGYSRHKGELLLVYEYMENGSLDKYLHGRNAPSLYWSQRYRIIKGVASSLLYLHEEWEQVILHRDVKASNVLLDSKMNGRLGDFWSCKDIQPRNRC